MYNFVTEFYKGQDGDNFGLPMGLKAMENQINGIQKGRIYCIASAPKVGKSTFADYSFLIQPYLYCSTNNIPIEFIYFSYEIDRVSKEFDFMCYFLEYDYHITEFELPTGVTKNGKTKIRINSSFLRGRMNDDNGNIILCNSYIENLLKILYRRRIIPIFGEYNEAGIKVKNGAVNYIETKENPTGMWKFIKEHASQNGSLRTSYVGDRKNYSYIPSNPKLYTIIITDHVRKIPLERNFTQKQTIDKWSEYTVELRNLYGYTFVQIIHLNRNMSEVDRLQYFKDDLFPTADDVKDSGNISEDCDYLFTMFNPNDDKYNLKNHFGLKIRNANGDKFYPDLRTIHLVESRHCEFPLHFRVEIDGNSKQFKQFK